MVTAKLEAIAQKVEQWVRNYPPSKDVGAVQMSRRKGGQYQPSLNLHAISYNLIYRFNGI